MAIGTIPRRMQIGELRSGDVLLCHRAKYNAVGALIERAIGSPYTHVALCTTNETFADSVPIGVRTGSVGDLVSESGHIAVLRNCADVWTPQRIGSLRTFVQLQVAEYNMPGVLKFKTRREMTIATAQERLETYFSSETPDQVAEATNEYFCSEFVVSCFISARIIDESAAQVLQPHVFAPPDLADDLTFGALVGYLSPLEYIFPEGDPSIHWARFDEVFGRSREE